MRKAIAVISTILFIATIALPVFAQGAPPAPAGLTATATSAQSATVSWDAMPAGGCSGDVDYAMYAINGDHVIDVFSAVNATSHDLNSLNAGTYSIYLYSYCYATDAYSDSPAETSVTIDSNDTGQVPAIADGSLGVAQVSDLSASVNAGAVTVTWDNTIGQAAPAGYCDVLDYFVEITDLSYATQDGNYVSGGSWTSSTLSNGDYIVWLTAYSQECDEWSPWVDAPISVS